MKVEHYGNEMILPDWGPTGEEQPAEMVVVDDDSLTAASKLDNSVILNFASHKRPGGGYKTVQNLRARIKTQEEDLFRRSNLPELMDNENVRKYYPLKGVCGLYCKTTVTKDADLNEVEPFDVSIITVPALVNPSGPEDMKETQHKIHRILEIAVLNGHRNLVLGAWGCGIFNNDPEFIAKTFKEKLEDAENGFKGCFDKVVFAVPGEKSHNHQVFKETFDG